MEFFNTQFLQQYGSLSAIQVIQLVILLLVAGMLWMNFRQQGVVKTSTQNFNELTKQLLGNMQTQQTQSNDRENKLATAIDRSAKALMLIHKEQKRQGGVMDDTQEIINKYHAETLKKFDDLAATVTTEINGLKAVVNREPGQHQEMMQSINRVLGYVEGMRLKIRTGENGKFATGEQPRVLPPVPANDARSDKAEDSKVEASEQPK